MKRKICLGHIALAAVILLSGCSGRPKLDRSESIAGPDTDGNGVRDDIDAYLQQRFPKQSQHAAAIQMAKAMQSAVVADAGNPGASQAASTGLSNAIHCLFIRFDSTATGADNPSAVTDEIEAITTNTKRRLLAYLAYNKSRDGTSSTSPDGDSCAGASTSSVPPVDPSPAQQLAQLEKEGKLPKLDRSASIAGPDTDGNGVRDDIDAYLRQRFPEKSQHAAAIQMAKGMQSAVMAGGNPDASREADRRINNAINCLHIRFDGAKGANNPSAVGHEIEAITSNTKGRLLAYRAYNKSLDGTTSSEPEGDTCE